MQQRFRYSTLCFSLVLLALWTPSVAEDSTIEAPPSFNTFLQEKDRTGSSKLSFVKQSNLPQGSISEVAAVATEAIKEGDVLYSYSLQQDSLHTATVYEIPELGPVLQQLTGSKKKEGQVHVFGDQAVKLALIYLKFVKPELKWQPYLQQLPSSFDIPLFWSPEEVEELYGSPLYSSSQKTKKTLQDEFALLFPALTQLHPTLFPSSVFTLENFMWAYAVFSSRSFWMSEKIFNPLFPLIEVFNFKDTSAVRFKENKDGTIDLIAKKSVAKGEIVIINDGLMGNQGLLEFFGFVLDKNPENSWEVGVGIPKDDKLFGNKLDLFKQRNIKNHQTFQIRSGEIPKDLVFALRVYHTSIYDFDSIEKALSDEVISLQNERSVAETLISMCRTSLKQYKTTGKEDKELLQTNLSRRHRNAVILRRGEKRILTKLLDASKEIYRKVKSQWDMRTMDVPGTPEMRVESFASEELL